MLSACAPSGQGAGQGEDAEFPLEDAKGERAAVEMTARAGGGFDLLGPYDFRGTLEPAPGGWELDASFTFMTGGYSIGEPRVIQQKRMPPHTIITVPVYPPAKDALVSQAITVVPIEHTFAFGEEGEISMLIEMREPGAQPGS